MTAAPRAPEEVKRQLAGGLLSFPVTHFTPDGAFDDAPYRAHIDWLIGFGPAALFAAGGTGEFFSLTQTEFDPVVRAAVAASGGRVPVIAGCGYGTTTAVELARAAEAAGADGLLLLPPYLMAAEQDGLYAHVKAVCDAVGIGIIVYNRDNAVLQPDTLARLADACPNLIGFKDGHGNIELVVKICRMLGDRLTYIGGMPTAEVFAVPYKAAGITTYSSAVFNFIPRTAMAFYEALVADDSAVLDRLLTDFFFPYLSIRDRRKGYAVSIVKAGMRVLNRPAGRVRPPLTDLTAEEDAMLLALMKKVLGDDPA